MDRAVVFRNLDRRQEWLGLEVPDLFALGFLTSLLMLVARHAFAWNFAIIIVAAVVLRLAKRGKPSGYLLALFIFYIRRRRPFRSAAARDVEQLPFGVAP